MTTIKMTTTEYIPGPYRLDVLLEGITGARVSFLLDFITAVVNYDGGSVAGGFAVVNPKAKKSKKARARKRAVRK